MRFCPFCSAENSEGAAHCGGCSRKLPPAAPRRKHRSTGFPAAALERVEPEVEPEPEPRADAVPTPVHRAPSGSGRLPPVPGRAARDRAAAERRPFDRAEDWPRARRGVESLAASPAPPLDPSLEAPDTIPLARPPELAEPAAPRPIAGSNGSSPARRVAPIVRERDDEWPDPADVEPLAAPRPATAPSRSLRVQSGPVAERRRVATETGPVSDDDEESTTPPTRASLDEDEDIKAIVVDPVPEVPDGGLVASVRYLIHFARGQWQRRNAIRSLKELIASDTAALDGILGALGRQVRELGLDNRVLAAENGAIDDAEARKHRADQDFGELQNRQAEENNRFAEIEEDREEKAREADASLEEAKSELGSLEAQRRGLRDKRKEIERRQKGLVKNAEDREAEAEKASSTDQSSTLRRAAEELRRDAAGLDPERQDIDRRLAALDRPLSKANAKVEALKAELESARRSLNDAREGHRHRLSEIEAEKGRKSRELAQADAEIQRRLVTLGTLVNLNRIERPEFLDIYTRIDVLRNAIGSRTNEIDRFTVEREAYDRTALTRGALTLAGAILALCLVIAILAW
jgi:hypothetical protein